MVRGVHASQALGDNDAERARVWLAPARLPEQEALRKATAVGTIAVGIASNAGRAAQGWLRSWTLLGRSSCPLRCDPT